MAKLNDPRRRQPSTPNLKISREHLHIEHATGANLNAPTSPPETPTAASPHMDRKPPQHGRDLFRFSRPLAQDPNIQPVGNGHQFSYQRRVLNPVQLSPRFSPSSTDAEEDSDAVSLMSALVQSQGVIAASSSEAARDEDEDDSDNEVNNGDDEDDDEDEIDDDDDDDDVEEEADDGDGDDKIGCREGRARISLRLASNDPSSHSISAAGSDVEGTAYPAQVHVTSMSASLVCNFIIEDMDPMDSGCEGLEILHPTEIESNRSRSRSRHKDFHRGMVRDFKNLNCSNETSDIDDEADASGVDEEALFRQRQRDLRRRRRLSTTSTISKRTHSELSDSDNSDVGTLDANDVGSSARRMRKRLHRGSLLFQDPPAPRIDELEEPDSSEEDYGGADAFARELPYWTMEIMEMESA